MRRLVSADMQVQFDGPTAVRAQADRVFEGVNEYLNGRLAQTEMHKLLSNEGDTSFCSTCGEPCEFTMPRHPISGEVMDAWWTHSIRGEDFDLADHPATPI